MTEIIKRTIRPPSTHPRRRVMFGSVEMTTHIIKCKKKWLKLKNVKVYLLFKGFSANSFRKFVFASLCHSSNSASWQYILESWKACLFPLKRSHTCTGRAFGGAEEQRSVCCAHKKFDKSSLPVSSSLCGYCLLFGASGSTVADSQALQHWRQPQCREICRWDSAAGAKHVSAQSRTKVCLRWQHSPPLQFSDIGLNA